MNHVLSFFVFVHVAMAIVVKHPSEIAFKHGVTMQMVEDRAHKKAFGTPGVCAIIVGDPLYGEIYTGVFVYASGDTGYVLTAAHGVSQHAPASFYLSFDHDIRDGQRIQVSQVHIHPKFDIFNERSMHDIALLEFKLDDSWKKMMPVPMDIRGDCGLGVFCEGSIVGYGQFATNDLMMGDSGRVHAGTTWVQLQSVAEGYPLFGSLLPHKANQKDSSGKSIVAATMSHHFDVRNPIYNGRQLMVPTIRIHDEQSMVFGSDIGGPLFLKNQAGNIKIAGIARGVTFSNSVVEGNERFHSLMTYWEPVFLYKEWIHGILLAPKKE